MLGIPNDADLMPDNTKMDLTKCRSMEEMYSAQTMWQTFKKRINFVADKNHHFV